MTGHGDQHLAAWQAEDVTFTDHPGVGPGDKAKIHDVATRLAAAVPGRQNDLPTPVKKGTRCSITAGDITATGTVRYSYTAPDPIARVELDGTGQQVDVPWALLGREQA